MDQVGQQEAGENGEGRVGEVKSLQTVLKS